MSLLQALVILLIQIVFGRESSLHDGCQAAPNRIRCRELLRFLCFRLIVKRFHLRLELAHFLLACVFVKVNLDGWLRALTV